MPKGDKNIQDSRAYSRQLERELIIGGSVVGLVVGVGLIYLVWGQTAATTSLLCFALFFVIAGLVWGFLALIGWLGERE